MAETVKSVYDLLADLADSAPAHSTNRQVLRNVVVSLESLINAGGTANTGLQVELDAVETEVAALQAGQASDTVGYATRAELFADLAHPAGTRGYVNADSTPANNGDYLKSGASGAGAWTQNPNSRLALAEASIAFLQQNFDAKSTANKADPNVVDAALPTITDQLWRVYNITTGTLSAASSSGLGSFAVTKKLDVLPSTQYTISMHGAPGGWGFYFTSTPFIGFYNANGTFHSQITSGFTDQTGGAVTPSSNTARSVTFTVPAGAVKVAFNLRNLADFSNSIPATVGSLTAAVNALMLNAGPAALDFVPYVAAGEVVPDPVIFGLNAADQIIVALQSGYLYVRTPNQAGPNDIVWRLLYGEVPAYTSPGVLQRSGVVDFWGAREIARSTSLDATIAAFNKATGAIWQQGTDERGPVHINGMYLGGTHGIIGYEGTLTAHGLTNASIGSTWTDGATKVWVLAKIVDANKVLWIADNTGATDKWVITTNAPTGLVMTWVTGGATQPNKTFTLMTQAQLTPILQNLSIKLYLDDVELTADGVYSGEKFRIEESWDLPNAAKLLVYLKANIGTTDYTNSAIAIQVSVSNSYTWNRWGAMTLYRTEQVKEAYKRTAGSPGDYSGAIQSQRLSLTSDTPAGIATSDWLYVPDIATVSGYDFKNVANVTANAAWVNIPKASVTNTSDPASHFAMVGKNGSSVIVSGMAWGYSRKTGYGIPATRAAKVTDVAYMSAAEKLYPIFVDAAAGDAVVGDILTVAAFKSYFAPDSTLTVPAVVYSDAGKEYAIVTSHAIQGPRWVQLPKQLIGKPVSVLKTDANVTLHTATVQYRGVMMSFATTYGDVVLEIG